MNKKITVLLFCVASILTAQIPYTLITGTLTNSDGSAFNGSMQISWPAFTIGSTARFADSTLVTVANGVLHLSLPPTDRMVPQGTTYSVTLISPGKPSVFAKWSVPSSDSPVDISAIYLPVSSGGSGSGTGTVNTGTAGQLAYYAAGGTTISGKALMASDLPYIATSFALPGSPKTLTYSWNGLNASVGTTGTGGKVTTSTAAGTSGNCAAWDANGNVGDAGAPCGSGSGGTVLNWRGAWSSSTAYAINDGVSYNGASYIAILAGTNHQPNTATTYWGILAAASTVVGGASGALDCTTTPGVCDVVASVVPFKATANAWTGANDFSGASYVKVPTGSGAPANGTPGSYPGACAQASDVGKIYHRSDAASANASHYVCSNTGAGVYSWELVQGSGSGGSGTVANGTAGQFAYYSASGTAVGGRSLVAGDIPSLNYQNPLTFTGSGAKTASSTGSTTSNDCAKWDASGNVIDAGAPCGSGSVGMNQLVYTKSGAYTFLTSDCGSHFKLAGQASSYSFPLPSPSAVAPGCRIEVENYLPSFSFSFVQVTGNIAGTASQIVTVAIGRTVAFVSDGATTWNLEYQAEGIESCAASSALVSGVYTVSLADAYKFVGGFCNGSSQPTSYVLPDVDNAAANGIPFFPTKGLWFDFVNSTNGIQTISGPSSGFGDFFTYTIPGQAQTFNSSSSYSLAPGATVRVILGGMTGTATPQAHWQVIGQTAQQTSFAPLAVSLAAGSGVTSVTCTSATCDVNGGRISIVGGTATTGVIATVSYTALTTAPRVCQVTMNGGTTFLGLGYGTPTTTSFTITAAVSVLGITFEADYTCRP